jgi:quercetin dioxygenase-like cupin family protein
MNFPEIIRNLPEINISIKGVQGNLLQGNKNQLVFFNFPEDTVIPIHTHGAQWGIVVDGRIDLTIGESTQTFRKGDSYFIPAGFKHGGTAYKGFKAIDFFDEAHRYSVK